MELAPEDGLACIEAAAYQVLFHAQRQRAEEVIGSVVPHSKVSVHLYNYPETVTHIRLIKSTSIGKLVTLRGTVVRVSGIKPLVMSMDFACGKCGGMVQCRFADGKYSPPASCGTDGCRSKTFEPNKTAAASVDYQKIRIQEGALGAAHEEGRVPRTIEVELKEALVDQCTAGDVVELLGFVKVPSKGKGSKQSLFLLYVDAVSLVATKRASSKSQQQHNADKENRQLIMNHADQHAAPNMPPFSHKDLEFVITFAKEFEGQQFRQLVHSLCPTIYGNELVKAGLLLALFGGVRKHGASASAVPLRGDIHVLIVGDPGLGKSQLLQAAAAVAPRGVYVCGTAATSAGLTVSVVKDAVTGDFAFEAGAMVLADRGTCCVDEFDKMSSEHQALLAAMEAGEVNVARAGMVAQLPARTSILAAANPRDGHYARGKTVRENLRMSPALLSRFDLTFILLDRPDQCLDQVLSEHVMALHSGHADRALAARQRLLQQRQTPLLPGPSQSASPSQQPQAQRAPLAERLRLAGEEQGDLLPPQLLQKYIAYARQYCFPKLSDEAKQLLREFYLELRQQAAVADATPVTMRQLESMVRLAEARARLELSAHVTAEHAQDVVELMRATLCDSVLNDYGFQDLRSTSRPGSKKGEAERFLAVLANRAVQRGHAVFSSQEIFDVADAIELMADTQKLIEQLNDAGELLKKGQNEFEVRSGRAALARAATRAAGANCSQSSFGSQSQSRFL